MDPDNKHFRQLLTAIVLGVLFIGVYVPARRHFAKRGAPETFQADSLKVNAYLASLDTMEDRTARHGRDARAPLPPREVFQFDPNTADSAALLRLGFRPFMAHNLINYRLHGGRIPDERKFKSIYGIDTLLIDSLRPYTVYPAAPPPDTASRRNFTPKSHFPFDLNTADTALLARLPGIGPGRARQITSYRDRLGGYASVRQLAEIEDFPDSVVRNLQAYAAAAPDSIKKINLNKTSIKRMRRHPYINYYQARAIYNLRWDRDHRGTISIHDLRTISEFSPEEIDRLLPYIEF